MLPPSAEMDTPAADASRTECSGLIQLPYELRIMVWNLTMPEDVAEVCILSPRHWHRDGRPVEDACLRLVVDTGFPVAMHVCRESRALAMRQTQFRENGGMPLSGSGGGQGGGDGGGGDRAPLMTPFRPFRPDLDILYMHHFLYAAVLRRNLIRVPPVQHLAVNIHEICRTRALRYLLPTISPEIRALSIVLPTPRGSWFSTSSSSSFSSTSSAASSSSSSSRPPCWLAAGTDEEAGPQPQPQQQQQQRRQHLEHVLPPPPPSRRCRLERVDLGGGDGGSDGVGGGGDGGGGGGNPNLISAYRQVDRREDGLAAILQRLRCDVVQDLYGGAPAQQQQLLAELRSHGDVDGDDPHRGRYRRFGLDARYFTAWRGGSPGSGAGGVFCDRLEFPDGFEFVGVPERFVDL